ncbi:MAG: hypothetical protein N4A47_04730 [Clostridia bacterium]|jgi:hypothetical protein|nr:hypothetical protein [Clostridia bacterium]
MKNELGENYDVYEQYGLDKEEVSRLKKKQDRCDRTDKECIRNKDHNTKKKTNIKKK